MGHTAGHGGVQWRGKLEDLGASGEEGGWGKGGQDVVSSLLVRWWGGWFIVPAALLAVLQFVRL